MGVSLPSITLDSLIGEPGPAGPAGVDLTPITSGTSVLDYGHSPSAEASVVAGQIGITPSKHVRVWFQGETMGDNDAQEHLMAGALVRLTPSDPIQNTGFTIYANNIGGLATGRFRTLERLSLSHQGQVGHWAGKKLPQSLIEKRTATRRARGNYIGHSHGKTRPAADALNTTIGRWGAPPRQVQCVDDGKIFEKVKFAAAFYGVGERHIRMALSGKTKATTVRGITFRYVDKP